MRCAAGAVGSMISAGRVTATARNHDPLLTGLGEHGCLMRSSVQLEQLHATSHITFTAYVETYRGTPRWLRSPLHSRPLRRLHQQRHPSHLQLQHLDIPLHPLLRRQRRSPQRNYLLDHHRRRLLSMFGTATFKIPRLEHCFSMSSSSTSH